MAAEIQPPVGGRPRTLNKEMAEEFVKYALPVPPDTRLPFGWVISAGGLAVPPVPVGLALQVLILQRRAALTEEQRGDPLYTAESPYWLELFDGERQEAIARYDGPSPPPNRKNIKARHTWWRGLTVDIVL